MDNKPSLREIGSVFEHVFPIPISYISTDIRENLIPKITKFKVIDHVLIANYPNDPCGRLSERLQSLETKYINVQCCKCMREIDPNKECFGVLMEDIREPSFYCKECKDEL